jgi:hypothetical protein
MSRLEVNYFEDWSLDLLFGGPGEELSLMGWLAFFLWLI